MQVGILVMLLPMVINLILLVSLLAILVADYVHIVPTQTIQPLLVVFGVLSTIPVIVSAVKALYKRKISVDLLASIALFVSMIQGEWVSVTFINLMITSARIFGLYTEGKAQKAIQSLLKLRPEHVNIKVGNELVHTHISNVKLGDVIVVETGQRIAVDGTIIEGQGTVDQSTLTGESMPIDKHEGDSALSATLVVSGTLLIKTEKIGKDTTFEKIVSLVGNAQAGKAGIQTLADRFASWYIFFTISGAALLYMYTRDTNLVLSVLLVTCADDIAVAIPMAFWAAIAYAAKRGIIIKGGHYLEGMARVSVMLTDKTGTLTKGHIFVQEVLSFSNHSSKQVMECAVSAASISDHPLSKAIMAHIQKHHTAVIIPDTFREYPGKGIVVYVKNKHIILGNNKLMADNSISFSYEIEQITNKKNVQGYTVVYVGYEKECIGCIVLADELRPNVAETIQQLKRLGVNEIVMLTGDNERVARHVMEETGITAYHANLLPEEKVAFVVRHRNKRYKIAYVGDGVNDAAALAAADIGIAMGAIGSDAAIESADIALMHDDIKKIPSCIMIGRHVMRVVIQNFYIWGIVNAVGLLLVFMKVLGPAEAAAFNFITDFIPLANSMRLFRRQSFDRVIG